RIEHLDELVAGLEDDQLARRARAREVLDRRERDGVVMSPGEHQRWAARVGLVRIAARVVEERDRQGLLAAAPVMEDGQHAVRAPPGHRRRADTYFPACREAE